MSQEIINVSDVQKILRDVQREQFQTLQHFVALHPNYHWTKLRYPKTGDTILHVLSRLNCVQIIEDLLQIFGRDCVDCKNNDNKTALHEAAQFARSESVEVLIKHGANVNALKKADWTPLMLACTKINENSLKTVETLLKHGSLVNYRNKDGWTVLHLISREGDVDILNLLLKFGLDLGIKSRNGRSALHVAALHGNVNVMKRLLELNVDVNDTDTCGNTALHEAVLGSNLGICDVLLGHNCDVDARNKQGFTILHLAAYDGSVDVMRYIVEILCFNVDVKNCKGLVPLHCAARGRNIDAYNFLLQCGADPTLKDEFGRVAHDYLTLK